MNSHLMSGKASAPYIFSARWTFGLYGYLYLSILIFIYTLLGIAYSINFGSLLYGDDFWFGGDLSRHIYWTIDAEKSFRSHLHPLSYLLFKGYGWLLNLFNILPGNVPLPVISLPIIFFTSTSIVICTNLVVPFRVFPIWLQIAVLSTFLFIGPTLVFTPVPESHVLGGVSLLMQALLIWLLFQQKINNEVIKISDKRWITGGIIFFAFLATGFTLSNLMPAIIMMFAVPGFRKPIFKIAVLASFFLVLLVLVHRFLFSFPFITRTSSNIVKETAWLISPDFSSVFLSIKNILLSQFGLSMLPEMQFWTSETSNEVLYYVEQQGATFIQVTAFVLWVMGILWWVFRYEKKINNNIRFLCFCTISLFSIIGFHSLYATGEAYIFSAHAWPYVVLPGVIVIRNSFLNRDYWPIVLIFAAVTLSVVQMIFGLSLLLNLKPPL